MNEKDRLGDKLRQVERGREDQYFAERDRELVEKLRRSTTEQMEEKIKEVALMRCPKCGTRLGQRRLHGVSVDECPSCHGVWLDEGELQQIASTESEGWIARWLRREFPEDE
jgi:ribosomal protein L37AE/L43A